MWAPVRRVSGALPHLSARGARGCSVDAMSDAPGPERPEKADQADQSDEQPAPPRDGDDDDTQSGAEQSEPGGNIGGGPNTSPN